jgi:vacuolar-type H+-ATPase subunit E/Vma4
MAINDILKKITDEGNKKAAFIKQVADDEIKGIKKEAQKKADARKNELEEKIRVQCDSVVAKSKTLAKMEANSAALKEKRELIDQAYSEVEKDLSSMESGEYVSLLASMMKSAAESIEKGSLVVPEGRKKETEEAISKSKADFHIKSETNDFKGGFIVTSGKVEVNLSFSYLVQKIARPSTELEVAKILFE